MTIQISLPSQTTEERRPRITVIGVGGAGGNAANNMIESKLDGVSYLVANTDGQALKASRAHRKIQLGYDLTLGLGAGADPEMGRMATEESLAEIVAELRESDMVFITAGMGGGTGTGGAPVIAKAMHDAGILTVGVVTKPFDFEGRPRMQLAEQGIAAMQKYVDTMIVIPNQNLLTIADANTTLAEAFARVDAVLYQAVSGITNLIMKTGIINCDFADVESVMRDMGQATMGCGEATGSDRAKQAAMQALHNPLLGEANMHGARAILINVTGGSDMTLFEAQTAANYIRKRADADTKITFGAILDDSLSGHMQVSVVATGTEEAMLPFPQIDEDDATGLLAEATDPDSEASQTASDPLVLEQAVSGGDSGNQNTPDTLNTPDTPNTPNSPSKPGLWRRFWRVLTGETATPQNATSPNPPIPPVVAPSVMPVMPTTAMPTTAMPGAPVRTPPRLKPIVTANHNPPPHATIAGGEVANTDTAHRQTGGGGEVLDLNVPTIKRRQAGQR